MLVLLLAVRPQGRALPGNLPRLSMRDRDTLRVDERIWTVDSEWVHIPNTVVRLDHGSDTRLFEYTKVAVDEGYSGVLRAGVRVRAHRRTGPVDPRASEAVGGGSWHSEVWRSRTTADTTRTAKKGGRFRVF
jgi:hypothetical protein